MKLIHDLRSDEERRALGHELRAIITGWGGEGQNVPVGAAYDALEEIRRHLEQQFFDGIGEAGESGLAARLIARLLGRPPRRGAYVATEDWARFQGQREALAAFMQSIRLLAAEAAAYDAARAQRERRPSEQPAQVRPVGLGRSAM